MISFKLASRNDSVCVAGAEVGNGNGLRCRMLCSLAIRSGSFTGLSLEDGAEHFLVLVAGQRGELFQRQVSFDQELFDSRDLRCCNFFVNCAFQFDAEAAFQLSARE